VRAVTALASTTRRFSFAAGHRYWVPAWSEAENRRVFGPLTVAHGHNYTLDVTVRGPIDERTGMVMDLAELKRLVGEMVVERFDHADLTADPLFRDRVPTTENIAIAAWELLAPALGPERLWQVRVWEDPTLYVDYRGGRP
jgi:6-pyruvoyltetrahydropterin/6-carboxytetrahydropterin synthase